MDDAPLTSLPDDTAQLRALIAQRDQQVALRDRRLVERDQQLNEQRAMIAMLTQERDAYYLEKLRLEVRLAKALKQVYGPRSDRFEDTAQMLLDFGEKLEALPIRHGDVPPEENQTESADESASPPSRRVRTRGRRDIGSLNHLPMVEQEYQLEGELCRCPTCRQVRQKIGEQISYTIEHVPAQLVRVKHIQFKYGCPHCESNGDHPQIELADKTQGSPIDKGLPGPGLLAYVATSKYADYLPLYRLQTIFDRQGLALDRSTLCLWMADVARLTRPIYDSMVRRVRQSQVLATDDTIMPLLHPGKTHKARMWIYMGDASQPYNVFDFTVSRSRDGPSRFLAEFAGVLLADAYGGYNGIVLDRDLRRAGCWSHARRKFVEIEKLKPEVTRPILRLIRKLFEAETLAQHLPDADRLALRRVKSQPIMEALFALFTEQKAALTPKHPLAEAIGYALHQWKALSLFLSDGAVPIHNNLAEQQMKRIALLRKNALFVGTPRGGETAAILSTITSTCRRHEINPQVYLTQLLAGLPTTPSSRLDDWLPDRWKAARSSPAAE